MSGKREIMNTTFFTPRHPRRELFFDFHTMDCNQRVGAGFDAAKLTDYFHASGADTIAFPFRCNQGFAYYNTRLGIRHPGLDFDLLEKLIECAHAAGLMVHAYANSLLSRAEMLQHPEWCFSLRPSLPGYCENLCPNSDFPRHLAEMIREVVSTHDVDGIFIDGGFSMPRCYCPRCLAMCKEEGFDAEKEENDLPHRRFMQRSILRNAALFSESAKSVNKDLFFFANGIPFEMQNESSSHLELECLPTSSWGYTTLPLYGRYIRMHGKEATNMTARFHAGWGDFGGLRPAASLEYDVFYGMALGLNTTIGDHMPPSVALDKDVTDLVTNVLRKSDPYVPYLYGSSSRSEILLIAPLEVLSRSGADPLASYGSCRMLSELKYQFDVISNTMAFPKEYPLVILPENVPVTDVLEKELVKHLQRGGKLIAAVMPGSDPEEKLLRLPFWPCRYGKEKASPVYLTSGGVLPSFPEMDTSSYAPGMALHLAEGEGNGEKLLSYVEPVTPKVSKEERFYQYIPSSGIVSDNAALSNGKIAVFGFGLFTAYGKNAHLAMRNILKDTLGKFLPSPLVKGARLPSFAKVLLSGKELAGKEILTCSILSYVPEKRGEIMEVVEEGILLHDQKIAVFTGERKVEKVLLLPAGENASFTVEKNYCNFTIPTVDGFAAAIVFFAERGAE